MLKGFRKEGGYSRGPSSSSVGFSSSGGFSGYSANGGNNRMKAYKGIDLKKYLPKVDPNALPRGIAAYDPANPVPELSAKEENIFTVMSRRFKVICNADRLYDCPKTINQLTKGREPLPGYE